MVDPSSSTPTANIFSNPDALASMLGGNGMFGTNDNTSGLVGGLILGSILRNNGNMFGNEVSAGRVVAATPNDVQDTVGFINTIQDINSTRRDVFQSASDVKSQIAQSLQAETTNNLQGQIALLTAINNSTQTTGNSLDALAASTSGASATLSNQIDAVTLSVAQGQSSINQNIANSQFNIAQAITNDGDKTRALIQGIETANLNRMITVAQNEISELRNERAVTGSGINVTNNINQNQLQQQQQQQLTSLNASLACLAAEIQRNTQSVVNLGTMTGSAGSQTASNTRVSG